MRLNKRGAAAGAAALLLGLTLTACGEADTGGSGGGGGDCAGKIGFMGALSGSNASVVTPSRDGAKLALAQWLEENDDCEIEMVEFDTEGDPAKATPVADQMVANQDFLGVVGGAFSGETDATKGLFAEGGLTMISQSATNTALTQENPSPVFHRVVGYDEVQGAAIAKYITDTLSATQVFVVDDGTTYGGPLGDKIKSELGDALADSDKTQEGQTDFSAVVGKISQAEPDAVVYAGYAAEAGPFVKQLRAEGYDGPFVGGDGIYGSDFPTAAGDAAEGAIITCPCLPADQAEGSFAEDFEAEYGTAPGAYAAEGFDAMNIFLAAFADGVDSRESMEEFVDNYEGDGITKSYAFDENGDVTLENVVIWSYKVEGGALVADQEISLQE